MKVRLLFLFVAAGASAAIAADSTPESLTAHFGARGTAGLVEMLPNLSKDRGTLDGLRGCTNGTEECDPSARFRAARGYPLAGESLVLFLTGTQPVDVVRVKRNGATAIEQRDVTTPAELFLGTAVDGETIVAVVERGTESLEFNVTVGNDRKVSEKAAAAWGYIGNWVYIDNGSCATGWYEVIEGSGTGGRCRSYYTDRAQRRELIWAFYEGSGYTRVGWKYTGSGRVYNVGPVYLPYNRQFHVSGNVSDDSLFSFIEGTVQKKIPIGTRP